MDITKRLNLNNIFLFLFLIAFPFGQIIRIGILQPIDVIAGLAAVYSLVKKFDVPKSFKNLALFLFFASFSWLFGIFIFQQTEVLYGLLYLFRLAAYFYFGVYVWNFVQKGKKNKDLLVSSLLGVSVASAAFGWIQFFRFPDIKPFFVWGWDMHLFRLVGTFLDPTFLALIIVFGLVLSIHRCISSMNWKNVLITIFLLVSLAFTYSRASYVAFAAAIFTVIYLEKRFKKLLLLVIGLAVLAFLLPTTKNHSIELFRSFSAIAKVENYQTTLRIFSRSPVFGIGYDNMCIAYRKYIGFQDFSSHACSGSDSSLLFILTTTGIVGFLIFIYATKNIASNLKRSKYSILVSTSFIALLVHSLFSNSMFYPWILGWMVILLALDL
jgi:O-antigen ligase